MSINIQAGHFPSTFLPHKPNPVPASNNKCLICAGPCSGIGQICLHPSICFSFFTCQTALNPEQMYFWPTCFLNIQSRKVSSILLNPCHEGFELFWGPAEYLRYVLKGILIGSFYNSPRVKLLSFTFFESIQPIYGSGGTTFSIA